MHLPTDHQRSDWSPNLRRLAWRRGCGALGLGVALSLLGAPPAQGAAGKLAQAVPGKAAAQKVANKSDKALLRGEGKARNWSAVYALLPPSIRAHYTSVKQYERSLGRRGSAVLVSLHQSGVLSFGIADGEPAAEQPVTFTILNQGVRSHSTGVVELVAEKGKWWLIGASSASSSTTTTTAP
jgi:hypothetical protein